MTTIGDHNAAASNQLPVTVPPRVAAATAADGSGGARRALLNRGERRSPEELKATFTQFVGETFYGQMIKSMRSTVGKPAYFHGGRGEEVFQGQLDQQMAQHLTEATAAKFAEPLFEQQFPRLAKQPQQSLNELTQLRRH
jgi:Rod binding domain-containing protein